MELESKTFIENLEKLRKKVIYCFFSIALGMVFISPFINRIMKFLTKPVGSLVFVSPYEAFFSKIQLTLFCGILISLPATFYIIYSFLTNYLPKHSRRLLTFFLPMAILLFLCGTMLCIFVMVPVSVRFFLGFSTADIRPAISIGKYISLIVIMSLAFGLIFELPLIILILNRMGIVSYSMLNKGRKYVIVIIFIIAAVLTPPDVITQIIMAVPMILLYEASAQVCRISGIKNMKKS